MKRILCMVLVLLMLLPMVIACKKNEAPPVESDGAGDVATSGEQGPVDLLDTIPSGNYGGREFIITVTGGKHEAEVCAAELTGETANDTIYTWLEKINGRYQVVVTGRVPEGDYWTAQQNEAASGAVATAIYGHHAYELHRPVSAGLYKNWHDMGDMIDLTADRWDQKVNNGVTWNGVLFGLTGDLGYTKLQGAMATYFNIGLLDEVGYSDKALYDMVDDGEWTFEAFEAIVKDFYIDSDYDNKKSGGDSFGFVATSGNAHDIWMEQFGIAITRANPETNKLEPILKTDENITIIQNLWSFYHENPGVFSNNGYQAYGPEDKFFSEGRAAMVTTRLSYAAQFAADLGTEAFGILPGPKRNEDQPDYYTKLFNEFAIWGVSKNIVDADIDFIAHITDALCAESSQTVYPTFYDILLKQRYSKDPDTARMVDIIMKTVNIDCTFMFGSILDSYCYVVRKALWDPSSCSIVSQYEAIERTLPDKLEALYALHQ